MDIPSRIFGYFTWNNNERVAWLAATEVPENIYINKWRLDIFNPYNSSTNNYKEDDILEFNSYLLEGSVMVISINQSQNQLVIFFKFPSKEGHGKEIMFYTSYNKFGHINWCIESKWEGKYLFRLDIFDVYGTLVFQQEVMTNANDHISRENLTNFLKRLPHFLELNSSYAQECQYEKKYNYFI